MDYGELITRSWRIVWQNKFLILLGFLAALGGVGNPGAASVNYTFSGDEITPGELERFAEYLANIWPYIGGLICLLVIIAIVFWLVRLAAQAGLISAAARIDAGEKVTLGESFSAGMRKVGRLIAIDLIVYGPFILLGLVAAGATFILASSAIGVSVYRGGTIPDDVTAIFAGLGIFIACIVLLICLLLPLLLFATVIYPFAQRGVVLQDLGVIAALGHGWRVVKANFGNVLMLILLFIVIGIVYGFIVGMVMFPLSLIAILPMINTVFTGGSIGIAELILLSGTGICFGLLAAVLNSIFLAFRSTMVTLAYQQFVEKVA